MNQQIHPRVLVHMFLECAIGVLGVFGSILCLCTVREFGLRVPEAVFIAVPLLMMAFCALFRLRRGGLYGAVAGLVILALMLLLRRIVFPSAEALWNLLCNHYAKTYDIFRLIHPDQISVYPAETEAALLCLAVLQTWICAMSLARWRKALPSLLALSLGVIPCYVALNTVPSMTALMMVILSVLLQILTQNVRRREPSETWKAVIWALVLSVLLLFGLYKLNPPERYEQPLTWEELARKLEDIGNEINNRGNVDAGLTGNPDEVVFDRLRSLPENPAKVMDMRTDFTGVCYLRGTAYTEFDGTSWYRNTDIDWSDRALLPYLEDRLSRHKTITLSTVEAENVYYTAYETCGIPSDAEIQGDAWCRNPDKRQDYSLTVETEAERLNLRTDPEYDAWVLANCTKLPEQTRMGLLEWWRSDGSAVPAGTLSPAQTDALAELAAERVSRCASYDRDPDRMPRDKDFCTWFVSEAERGYCVHYAASCAALLRALGIPARYASGFIVQGVENTSVEVTTLNAHAWVEYYNRGAWHMLEPTPGDAWEFVGVVAAATEPRPSAQPYRPSETPPPGTTEPTPPPTAENTNPPQQQPTTPQGSGSGPSGDGSQTAEPAGFPDWAWIPIGLAALILLLVLRRALVQRHRARQLERAPSNEKARLIFRRYRRFCGLTSDVPTEQADALAKKAVFSQHRISREELDYLQQCLDRQAARAAASGFWRRLYLRYVLAVL